jgi:hypothetical protein
MNILSEEWRNLALRIALLFSEICISFAPPEKKNLTKF